MTRRHFQRFAEGVRDLSANPTKEEVAAMIATACKEFNSNFDRDRFTAACAVK